MVSPAIKAPSGTPRRIWTRRLRRISVALLLAALLLGAGAFFGLRWFESAVTFHAEGYQPGPLWMLPPNAEDVWLQTADHVRLHGWFIHSNGKAGTAPAATVIYFHGNGGNVSNVGWVGRSLARHGYDVLLFDYRGYGRSDGSVGDETTLDADGDAAYDYVRKRGASPEHIALYGQSLGTTTAVDLAWRRGCGALVLESGLSSASDLAASMLPWLPRWVHRLGCNRFESARKLAAVHCPVLVTHGDPDDTIPTDEGRMLFASANQPKRLMILAGAGHNVVGFGGEKYLDAVADFIQKSLCGQ